MSSMKDVFGALKNALATGNFTLQGLVQTLQNYAGALEDAEGGGGGGSSAIEYSTTEKKIGKWIDGSDLYQITFTGTGNDDISLATLGLGDVVGVDAGGTYCIRSDVNVKIFLDYNNPQSANYGWGIEIAADKSKLMIVKSAYNISEYAITIRYTKAST